MVEAKIDYSIGHLRMKYLDLANIKFAQGDLQGTNIELNNFIETIKETSSEGMMIKIEFDKISIRLKEEEKNIEKAMINADWLSRMELEELLKQVRLNSLHDKKTICWRALIDFKLYNDNSLMDYEQTT